MPLCFVCVNIDKLSPSFNFSWSDLVIGSMNKAIDQGTHPNEYELVWKGKLHTLMSKLKFMFRHYPFWFGSIATKFYEIKHCLCCSINNDQLDIYGLRGFFNVQKSGFVFMIELLYHLRLRLYKRTNQNRLSLREHSSFTSLHHYSTASSRSSQALTPTPL